jgi:hypothetical protein
LKHADQDRDDSQHDHDTGCRTAEGEDLRQAAAEVIVGNGVENPGGPGVAGFDEHRSGQRSDGRGRRDDDQSRADVDKRAALAGQRHLAARAEHTEYGDRDRDRQRPLA